MKCSCVMLSLFSLSAMYPASVHAAFMSAPVNPSVSPASTSCFTSLVFIPSVCRPIISFLPIIVGIGTSISRSILPGLSNAGSSTSFLFVHPITFTVLKGSNPSISDNNCRNVLCTSLSPPVPASSLVDAIASISSMNIIAGDFCFASANNSFTSFAPSPINFCTSSLPTTWKNVALVLDAISLANNVFPVPGGPYNSTPFGGTIPIFLNNSGFSIGNSITSCNSLLCSSSPPIGSLFMVCVGFKNFSTSFSWTTGIFSTITRFLWSATTVSPG